MNHFFSQLVADKKIKRQIKLLQTIYNANYPITLDEIADDFGTSKRTLFRDMKDLEHILPEDDIVEYNTISGYTINHTHLIEDLVVQVSEQSPLYTIVNNVYDEIFLTIDEWADDLFLSTSTLYRYLGDLKKILKEFKLELTLTPVAIVGEEVNIRHFYFHFFYNTNDISSMNSPTEKHQKIFHDSYSFFMKVTNQEVTTQHRSALYWLMVTNKRLEQGHTITLGEDLKKIVKHLRAYEFMPQFGPLYFPDIEEQYVTEDEILYASLLTLDNYVYEEGELYEIEDLLDAENLTLINTFLVRAFMALDKELPDKETLSLYVLYFRNLYFLTKLTPLFQKNSMEVNKLIKHRHPVMYTKWLEILSEDLIKEKFAIEYVEDVAVNLAMFTYFSQHGKSHKKKHVLFTFDGKKAYLNYLNIMVNSFVNQNVEVTFLVNQHITNKVVEDLGADIVIYNYREDSERLDCVKYRTERMPTEHDWERINNLIFDEQ
ncbi:helix-turn-helix domain-containing protein [Listeria grandensis]|uniref:helix-turn-helix domain-containing protein n=1 Tax=Listeria grandensis TaxID=1494963 RepID=UPI00164D60ED|nr:helix-turn-helix domain-containing protein [Listeria grandensis]MBC6316977.1 HTH domain-containing protein [Listeria grandensis]